MKATGKVAKRWKSLQPTQLGHLDKTKERTMPHGGVIYTLPGKQELASRLQQFHPMYTISQKKHQHITIFFDFTCLKSLFQTTDMF